MDFGVVNYNGGASVVACVRSILSQRGPQSRVLVFDNASTDGSPDELQALFPEIAVVRSDRNLGYAGALNRLLERMDAPIVVLSNMDLEFEPGWAEAVVAAFDANPRADAASSLVVETTEPPVVNSVGIAFFSDLHAQNVGSGEPYHPDRAEEIERLRKTAFGSYGAVMCFRREAVRELPFDEDYFLFFEETDFFLRFALSGHETIFAEGAVARHQRSLSTRRYSPLKLYYGERNRLTTVFKLLPVWYWPVSFVHTFRRLSHLARQSREPGSAEATETPAVLPSRATILLTLLRAWIAAVARLPGTLRKRARFWRAIQPGPAAALALMRRYGLSVSELRLR